MLFTSVLGFAGLAAATPVGSIEDYVTSLDDGGGASEQNYTSMKYYVQHAAAAYCNFDAAPGRTIVCGKNACPLVQQNEPTVMASFAGQHTGIGAYVAVDVIRREIVLSVRGSSNIRNFITDIIFAWQGCDLASDCKVHTGFAKSWEEIQDAAARAIRTAREQNPGFRVVATGHSLGGAVATLAAAHLRREGYAVDVYTYGSPRVGNDKFADWMTGQPGGQWRVTHHDDPVPRLPPIFVGYRHISPEYWLSGGRNTRDDDWPIGQLRVCKGIASTACNGGTFGLDILAHLHYLGETSACGGSSLVWKRDDASDDELEQRLDDWSRKDQDYVGKSKRES
ncbi:hypothetical protein EsDP_00002764 [Epichloe bromicola]|uniref:Fungal lipase-type domain-containing protein n=1 Tax=Epichloe bromicola TaxID=79588 RepID=A0ABQ0CLR6_9HYPO